MDKLLLNGVGTLGSVDSTYIVGLISFIIIGVSLLIILYRIVKWMIRLDEMMTSLVAQTYIQPQKEKYSQYLGTVNDILNYLGTTYGLFSLKEENGMEKNIL